jgi:hypothetical protein
LNDSIQFGGAAANTADITEELQKYGLLGNNKGIALDTLRLKLDMKNDDAMLFDGKKLENFLQNGIGYLRFTAHVTESFSSGAVRKGNSDVIVKFTSSGEKIFAYKVAAVPSNRGMQVALPAPQDANFTNGRICNGNPADPNNSDNIDRVACRVIKNEVIGLRINPTNLTNFKWTINGADLTCSSLVVSPNCEKDANGNQKLGEQNHVNFFPVTGDVGDTYTVTVTANDISGTATNSESVVTLSRVFHVVEPSLTVASLDTNTAWPKLLGQYKDVAGTSSTACPGGLCSEYSDKVLEGFSGELVNFQAKFVPNFLADRSSRQWTVDGVNMNEGAPGKIAFNTLKTAPDVYNVSVVAAVVQPQDIRQALRDIWGVSPLDSPEIHFTGDVQLELLEPGLAQGIIPGSKKYLAAIASYIPGSVMFSFRIVLSIVLLLFTANILFALLPERLASPGAQPSRRE